MFKKFIITSLNLICIFSVSVYSQNQNNDKKTLRDTITDKNIVVPPEVDRTLDQLFTEWNKNIRKSPICETLSDNNVSYPDTVYIDRLHAFPSEMELSYNQIVRSYIDMYSGRRRGQVAYMLAEGDYYFPIFESMLDKYGLPLELKYLPVIESALNPRAVSPMGATGLWQFMLGTGKMYSLEINSLVDERRDPIKSSEAAVKYLRDLYKMYGDWNLVIAAYNCGPGTVNKAIRRSGGQKDYWAIYNLLPRETRGYVPIFIAATYIMTYHKEHNICPLEYKYPPSMDTLAINKTVHLQQIAEVLDIPIEDVRALNPQYKNDIVPGDYKQYFICLPSEKITDFISKENAILAYKAEELFTHRKTVDMGEDNNSKNATSTKWIKHRIKKGETLGKIASRYGVTSNQIKSWNNLKSNRLVAGKSLSIARPVYAEKKAESTTSEQSSIAQNKTNYSEDSEDTSDSTNDNNNLIADYLKKQIEKTALTTPTDSVNSDEDVPLIRKNFQEATKTIYHKVRIGETISLIANKYDVTREDIINWNKLTSNAIRVGQRLVIYIPDDQKKETESDNIATSSTPVKTEITKPTNAKEKDTTKGTVEKVTPSSKVETTNKESQPAKGKENIQTTKSSAQKKETTTKKSSSKPKAKSYVVKKGDNLYNIARKYPNISADDIKKANNLKSDKLSINQKLIIPASK